MYTGSGLGVRLEVLQAVHQGWFGAEKGRKRRGEASSAPPPLSNARKYHDIDVPHLRHVTMLADNLNEK